MSRIIVAGFVAVLTTACLADLIYVEAANERFIQLADVTTFTEGEALEVANEHCKKFGRFAQLASSKPYVRRYNCVE